METIANFTAKVIGVTIASIILIGIAKLLKKISRNTGYFTRYIILPVAVYLLITLIIAFVYPATSFVFLLLCIVIHSSAVLWFTYIRDKRAFKSIRHNDIYSVARFLAVDGRLFFKKDAKIIGDNIIDLHILIFTLAKQSTKLPIYLVLSNLLASYKSGGMIPVALNLRCKLDMSGYNIRCVELRDTSGWRAHASTIGAQISNLPAPQDQKQLDDLKQKKRFFEALAVLFSNVESIDENEPVKRIAEQNYIHALIRAISTVLPNCIFHPHFGIDDAPQRFEAYEGNHAISVDIYPVPVNEKMGHRIFYVGDVLSSINRGSAVAIPEVIELKTNYLFVGNVMEERFSESIPYNTEIIDNITLKTYKSFIVNNIVKHAILKLSGIFEKSSAALPETENDVSNAPLPDFAGVLYRECDDVVREQLGVSLGEIFASRSTASASLMLAGLEQALSIVDLSTVNARYGAELDTYLSGFEKSLHESANMLLSGLVSGLEIDIEFPFSEP